jgi:hypothetical protein
MAAENTVSQLNGLFKEVYGDKLKDLVPDGVMLYNMIPFVGKDKATGNLYHQPVILGQEHGFSYGGTAGDAFTLNEAIAAQVKDSQVQGYEFLLRSKLSYGAVARSMNSKSAFESATKLVVANMIKSFAKRIEVMIIYGQSGLASITTGTDISGSVITIPAAQWAPGIWSGSVNMKVALVDDGTPTLQDELTITAVDLEARQLTFSGSVANASGAATLFHKGAVDGSGASREFAGLHKIMTNTGTLFNISATTYDLWRSVEHSASSGALSFAKIQKAIAKSVAKGLDEDVVCLVNPKAWSDLLNDQAALRMYDSSFKPAKAENGSEGIVFYSQNGKIEIRPCNHVKEAHAFMIPVNQLMRIGSTDVTFKLPGSNDKFFRELDGAAGYELRAYSDQALFCAMPARLTLIKDIVNS